MKNYKEYSAIAEKLQDGDWNDLNENEKLIWLSSQDQWDDVCDERLESMFYEPDMQPSDAISWDEIREGFAEYQKEYGFYDDKATDLEVLYLVLGVKGIDESELTESGKIAKQDIVDDLLFQASTIDSAKKIEENPHEFLDELVEYYYEINK